MKCCSNPDLHYLYLTLDKLTYYANDLILSKYIIPLNNE